MRSTGLALAVAAALLARADARPNADAPGAGGVERAARLFDRAAATLDGWVSGRAPSAALVRIQIDVRDLSHAAERWLLAWSRPLTPPSPKLAVLRTSPITHAQNSGFGWRDDPVSKRRRKFHTGTDFRADRGTPVHAAGDGVVVFAGRLGGYGRTIHIDHGGGVVTRYAHLSRIEADAGELVTAAQPIGAVGSTGRTTGPHLHFEVRLDGRPVDPMLAMKVGELERTAPELAALAAMALSPTIQFQALDADDETNRRRARAHAQRPAPSGRRSQALW